MKKIIAGLLASASVLAMSVSASAAAADKTVTKAGDITYDVAVTAPKVVLNLTMPAKMTAALNPYGADIKLDTAENTTNTTKLGIASVAYKVSNLSKDYGVFLDATAITTISTTDKPKADKTPAWGVVTAAIADDNGVKNANMALMAFKDIAAMKAATAPADESAEATASTQGALVLDSTVKADKTKGIVAGQTSQKKFAYIKASTDGTAVDVYIGFLGKLGETKPAVTTAGSEAPAEEVEWKEDDAINVNLVIKVTAGPKTLT